MHSNNCLPQALSYYQPQGASGPRGAPGEGSGAHVVGPKAKVGVMLELDLGSGYVRLTESCDQQRYRVHGLSFREMAELFSGCFGPSNAPKSEVTDYARQWHELRAALRRFICEEPTTKGTPAPTGTSGSPTTDLECREKLAQVREAAMRAYSQLITDVCRNPKDVLKVADELKDACA